MPPKRPLDEEEDGAHDAKKVHTNGNDDAMLKEVSCTNNGHQLITTILIPLVYHSIHRRLCKKHLSTMRPTKRSTPWASQWGGGSVQRWENQSSVSSQ